MTTNEISDRWAFTAWESPRLPRWKYEYMCWSLEYTPTSGLSHYQGYIEFKKPYTMRYVKSLFKTKNIHLGPARSDRETNYNYCMKDRQCIEDSYESEDVNEWLFKNDNIIQLIFGDS